MCFNIKDRYQTKPTYSFLYLIKKHPSQIIPQILQILPKPPSPSSAISICQPRTKKKMQTHASTSFPRLNFVFASDTNTNLICHWFDPRATIPSISIKVGRCVDNACATLLSLPLLFVSPESGGERGGGGGKKIALLFEKRKGKEAKRVKRSLLGASLRSARCRVFFRPLSAWQIVSKTVAGTWATSPPRLRRPRFLNAFQTRTRFVRSGFVLNFYNERRFLFIFIFDY